MVMVFFILLTCGDFLLTKIGCFRLTLFGYFRLTLTQSINLLFQLLYELSIFLKYPFLYSHSVYHKSLFLQSIFKDTKNTFLFYNNIFILFLIIDKHKNKEQYIQMYHSLFSLHFIYSIILHSFS